MPDKGNRSASNFASWVFESSEATGNDRLVLLALAFAADDIGGGDIVDFDTCRRWTLLSQAEWERAIDNLINHRRLVVGQRHYIVTFNG